MDSKELADLVADSFDGFAPMVKSKHGYSGVDIHAVVKATLEELARAGFIRVEEGEIEE